MKEIRESPGDEGTWRRVAVTVGFFSSKQYGIEARVAGPG